MDEKDALDVLVKLKLRRMVEEERVVVCRAAKADAAKHKLHLLSKSQLSALSNVMAQGKNFKHRLQLLKDFLGKDGIRKRLTEGKGWLEKVAGDETRLDVVAGRVDNFITLVSASPIITALEQDNQDAAFRVAERLITCYIHYIERWAELQREEMIS